MEVYIGMKVEASCDEDGFQGAWFKGTIVGRVQHSQRPKYFIHYDHFINNEWDREPLIECFFIEYLRPIPPPSNLSNLLQIGYGIPVHNL